MEETKLLRLLVLTITSLLLFKPCVYGGETDMEWAQEMATDNQRIFMDNLKEMMEMVVVETEELLKLKRRRLTKKKLMQRTKMR